MFDVLAKRMKLDYWPKYQTAHFFTKVVNREINDTEFEDWRKGRKGYLIDEGMVNITYYNMKMAKNEKYTRSTVWSLVKGDFDPRKPLKTGPFLTNIVDFAFPSYENITDLISASYRKRLENPNISRPRSYYNRTENLAHNSNVKRSSVELKPNHATGNELNFNDIALEAFDWVIANIVRLGISLKDAVDLLVDRLATFDYLGFFQNNVKNFFVRWSTCTIPDNIDGTTIYNPLCFPLLPQNIYDFVTLTPNDIWPRQVGLFSASTSHIFRFHGLKL